MEGGGKAKVGTGQHQVSCTREVLSTPLTLSGTLGNRFVRFFCDGFLTPSLRQYVRVTDFQTARNINGTKYDSLRFTLQTPSRSTHERCGLPRAGKDELVHGPSVSTAYPLIQDQWTHVKEIACVLFPGSFCCLG